MKDAFDKLYLGLLMYNEYIIRTETQGNVFRIITNTLYDAEKQGEIGFILSPTKSYWHWVDE